MGGEYLHRVRSLQPVRTEKGIVELHRSKSPTFYAPSSRLVSHRSASFEDLNLLESDRIQIVKNINEQESNLEINKCKDFLNTVMGRFEKKGIPFWKKKVLESDKDKYKRPIKFVTTKPHGPTPSFFVSSKSYKKESKSDRNNHRSLSSLTDSVTTSSLDTNSFLELSTYSWKQINDLIFSKNICWIFMSAVSLSKPNVLFRIPVTVQPQALPSMLLRFKIEKIHNPRRQKKATIFLLQLYIYFFVMSYRLNFHILPPRPSIDIAMI